MPARHRSKPGRMLNHSFASSTDSTAPLHSANPPASAGDRCTPPLPQAVQHHAPTMESKHIKFSEWFLWCLILLWNPLRLPKPGLIIITYPAKNLWNAGLLFSCCGFAKRANQIRTNWHSRTHNKRTNMTTSQIKNHPSTVLLSHVFSHQAAVDQEWLARLQCCSHVGHQGMEPSIAEWQILKYPGCTDLLFYCLTCFHYWQDRNFCNLRFGALTAHWKANKKLRTEVLVPVPQQPVGIASIALKRPISCFLQLLEIPQQTWNIRKTGCPGSLGHPIFHYHILTHILTWKIGCPGSLGHPIFQEFVLKYSDSLGMLADICSNQFIQPIPWVAHETEFASKFLLSLAIHNSAKELLQGHVGSRSPRDKNVTHCCALQVVALSIVQVHGPLKPFIIQPEPRQARKVIRGD